MTFIFWQNIISIHQQSFLEALARRVPGVILVVERDILATRRDMGWEVPQIAGVQVVVAPGADQVREIIGTHPDAIHIMGGIRIGALLSMAFDECVKQRRRIGIMTEPYNAGGIRGMLRGIKYRIYSRRYFRQISFVLAIGREGVAQYAALGYNARTLFPWAYFIAPAPVQPFASNSGGTVRIMYAGRLEEGKGIYRFAEQLLACGHRNFQLGIYGEGADEPRLRQLFTHAGMADKVTFTGFMKHASLLQQYSRHDWVVLPSTGKDGWGVVVSEALMHGLKAACSTRCGVSRVVQEGVNGTTFDWNEPGSCRHAIDKMLTGTGFATPAAIAAWAGRSLTGDAGAAYFLDIIGCVFGGGARPSMPWESPEGRLEL